MCIDVFCVTSLIVDAEDQFLVAVVDATLVVSSLLLATVAAGKLDHVVEMLEGVNMLGASTLSGGTRL